MRPVSDPAARRARRAAHAGAAALAAALAAVLAAVLVLALPGDESPGARSPTAGPPERAAAGPHPPGDRPAGSAARSADHSDGPAVRAGEHPGELAARAGGGHAAAPAPEEERETCLSVDHAVRLAYPAGWHHSGEDGGSPCRAFGPEPIPHNETDSERHAAIYLDVYYTDFDAHVARSLDAGDPFGGETTARRTRRTEAGHRAVRYERVAGGDGYHPEGTRTTGWLVDLGDRTVAAHTADVEGPGTYEENVAALRVIAETVTPVEPGEVGPADG